MSSLSQNILSFFEKKGGPRLTLQTSLKDDLVLDSLDITSIIMDIEKKYKINFDDVVTDRSQTIETIGDVVKIVETLMQLKNKHKIPFPLLPIF